VSGQRALTLEEYLASRHYRGMNALGKKNDEILQEIVTEKPPPEEEEPKRASTASKEAEELKAIDWSESKLFQMVKAGKIGNIDEIEEELS
jgi:hypothetical protein